MNEVLIILALIIWLVPFIIIGSLYFRGIYISKKDNKEHGWGHWYFILGFGIIPLFNLWAGWAIWELFRDEYKCKFC